MRARDQYGALAGVANGPRVARPDAGDGVMFTTSRGGLGCCGAPPLLGRARAERAIVGRAERALDAIARAASSCC